MRSERRPLARAGPPLGGEADPEKRGLNAGSGFAVASLGAERRAGLRANGSGGQNAIARTRQAGEPQLALMNGTAARQGLGWALSTDLEPPRRWDYEKGAIVFDETPAVIHDDIRLKKRCLLCAHCGARAGSISQNLLILCGKSRRSACTTAPSTPALLLPELLGGARAGAAAVTCGEGCDDVFCSEACKAAARLSHATVCGRARGGGGGEGARELRRHARRAQGDALLVAPKLLARVISDISDISSRERLAWVKDVAEEEMRGGGEEGEEDVGEEMEEAAALAKVSLLEMLCGPAGAPNEEESLEPLDLEEELEPLVTPRAYAALLRGLEPRVVGVAVPSPFSRPEGDPPFQAGDAQRANPGHATMTCQRRVAPLDDEL
ncbi:hypothetical protein T484DRAFT_1921971 [Baffinella frigidus]|nr:hypothetical protein T484DRAFT_1921971 [Cryptophyta sp. CCMP2293]